MAVMTADMHRNGIVSRKPRPLRLPDSIDLGKLCTSITRDRKDLEPFRNERFEAVAQYTGAHYGDNAAPVEVPVNLIGAYVQIMLRSLVAQNPRVMYSTFEKDQQAAVAAMQQWANEEILAMDAAETYRRAVLDALFWRGVVMIGLATPMDSALNAWDVKAGQPFMEGIDPDDVFEDQTARRFDQCAYRGHRYRVPVDLANDIYAKGKADRFEAEDLTDYNYGGDERIATLSRGIGRRDEFEDHCDLWCVYLARHKLIVTLRDNGGIPDETHGPVRVQPYIGHPQGPYYDLKFMTVPGNLQPKAPIMDLIDLHRSYNNAYRKLLRQTRDYKQGLAYRGANTDEAKRWKDMIDGAMIQSDNPESIKPINNAGPANTVLVMCEHIKSMFEFIGGNLGLLGGRGAQSRTATQDKMLNENAGAGVVDLQDATTQFVQTTMEGMNWLWWHHPTKNMRSRLTLPSAPELPFTRTLRPQDRNGRPPQVKVDPYSLPRQTPETRLAFINQTLQMFAPFAQMAQQQGVTLDLNALMDVVSRYGNEPELNRIFTYSPPPDPTAGQGSGGDNGGMPANTKRTYERISSGGGSEAAKQDDLTKNIARMSGPVNPNQGQ